MATAGAPVSRGYLAVYLMAPYDLLRHISTSMDRLLVQVWPTFVFAYCLLLATPQESFSLGRRSESG